MGALRRLRLVTALPELPQPRRFSQAIPDIRIGIRLDFVPAQIGIAPVLDAALPIVEHKVAPVGSDHEDRMSFARGRISRCNPQSARRPAHCHQPTALGQRKILTVAAADIHLPDIAVQFVAGVVSADHRTIDGVVDILQLQHFPVRQRDDRQTIVVAAFGGVLGAEQHLSERRNDRSFFRDIAHCRTAGQAAGKACGAGGEGRAGIRCCKSQCQKCNERLLHLLIPVQGNRLRSGLPFFSVNGMADQ
ncbi:hypothetical protein RHECNPAF_4300108 [Rhizobium etli CNPAF512]|nr:hypothetical protein RHECNPAF_4300108 [Rhizobium etli CNPAF512]